MSKDKSHLNKIGASLADREKHEEQHKTWNRRSFIKTTGLAGFGLSAYFSGIPVMSAASSAYLEMLANSAGEEKILVLINLNGGNDGLNTVVEKGNDEYYRIRPNIALQNDQLWHLDDKYGMHGSSSALRPLWENGAMKIIHNVGYPNPNYSHFRSSDIWATATDSNVVEDTGWIGRYMQEEFPLFLEAQPTHPPAIQIGVQTELIFKSNEFSSALVFRNPEEFYQLAQNGNLYDTEQLGDTPRERELKFLRQAANSAFRYSNSIRKAYTTGNNASTYPNATLGRSMGITARLIKGGLRTKVYMVSIGGFDTHADQLDGHARLMQTLGNAVAAFYQDIGESLGKRVMCMTFSEFGRTIFENGSMGTDHGTGAPILMFGGGLGQGHVGSAPNLLNTDQYGDPYFEVDFKDVYHTVLTGWMGIDPRLATYMLGKKQNILPNLIPPQNHPVGANAYGVILGHRPHPTQSDIIQFQFASVSDGEVIVELLTTGGQSIRTLFKGYLTDGTHVIEVNRRALGLPPGNYQYRLVASGKAYYRSLQL